MKKRTTAKRKDLKQKQIRRSLNAEQQDWLIESLSLTERMSQESEKDFKVKCLPFISLHKRHQELQRRVILCYKGTPWVYAESTLKRQGLGWRQHYMNLLGNRSIGTFVIRKFRLEKVAFRVELLASNTAMMRRLQSATDTQVSVLWSRYSEYHWGKHVLVVKEVFLPASKMLG